MARLSYNGQVAVGCRERNKTSKTKKMERKTGRRRGDSNCVNDLDSVSMICIYIAHFMYFFGGSIKASCHSSTLNSTILYATALGEAIDGLRELCFFSRLLNNSFWVVFGRRAFSLLFPSTSIFTAHHLFRSSGRGENKNETFFRLSHEFS